MRWQRRRGWLARTGLDAAFVVAALGGAAGAAAISTAALAQPADPPKDPKKAEAMAAFEEGNKKFEAGDFAGAYLSFKKADDVVPGAVPKFRMAEALDRAGDGPGAQKAYQAFLDSKPPKDKHKERIEAAKTRIDVIKKTPPKFFRAEVLERNGDIQGAVGAYQEYLDSNPPKDKQKEHIDTATSHIAALKATPADVKVTVTPATAALAVDGVPQATNPLKVPPGKHVVSAKADGFVDGTADVEAGPGDKKEITITLSAKAAPIAATPPSSGPPPTKPPAEKAEPPKKASKVPAAITLSLAGAGAIVGAVFGGLALKSKSDFNATPTQDLYDQTERDALIADMSFGVAITFGVTGVVLLVTSSNEDSADKEKKAQGPKFFGAPWASPHGGGAVGVMTF